MTGATPTDPNWPSWEAPVRDISLAARSEMLDDMSLNWHKLIGQLQQTQSELAQLWNAIAEWWQGDAAETAGKHWEQLVQDFEKVIENYGQGGLSGYGVPGDLSVCAQVVRDTIGGIPIPLFADGTSSRSGGPSNNFQSDSSVNAGRLPGNTDAGWDNSPDAKHPSLGGLLYQDYRAHDAAYADSSFYERALRSGAGNRTEGSVSGHGTRYDGHGDTSGASYDLHNNSAFVKKVRKWYNDNHGKASTAAGGLARHYAQQQPAIPTNALTYEYQNSGSSAGNQEHHGPSDTGPTDGAGLQNGGGAGPDMPSLGSFPPPATGSPDAGGHLPDAGLGSSGAGSASMPNTGWNDPSSGLAGVGSGAPQGLSAGGGLGSSFGGGGVPGVGSGGAGDLGGAGGIGGVGGAPDAAVSPLGRGSAMGPETIGPRALAPNPAEAMSGRAGGSGMGVGAPGAAGSARGQERDRSMDWLREDENIWYDEDLEPPQIPWVNGYRGPQR